MPDWSRRHVLQAVAMTGALSLAGCSGVTTGSNAETPIPRSRLTDVEAVVARNDDGEPPFVVDENPVETGIQTDGDIGGRFPVKYSLTDQEDLEAVHFRDGATDLQAFVTATDLESASVLLVKDSIGECYVPRLAGVVREGTGVDVDVCRDLRPAGFECDVDEVDSFAIAIRLPFAEFSGVGGSAIGDCGDQPVVRLTEAGDGS